MHLANIIRQLLHNAFSYITIVLYAIIFPEYVYRLSDKQVLRHMTQLVQVYN